MGSDWSHTAWQPLIEAFITSYKEGGTISSMVTPNNHGYAAGAMWYKTILQDASCINDDGKYGSTGSSQYWEKPDGFDSGSDTISWAVVMPLGTYYYTMNIYSGGTLLKQGIALSAGLNYGEVPGMKAGVQKMEMLDEGGNIFMTATGGRCVSSGCPDFIYNMNYQVIGLTLGTAEGACTSSDTDIYVPPAIWTESNPTVQCIPPCGIILPPLDLGYTTTIDWPPLTTSVWVSSAGSSYTKTTVLDIPPVTTTAVDFWRLSVASTETAAETFTPVQSIMPPPYTLTLAATEATFAPVPSGSSHSPPTFSQTQHVETIQPQATVSVSIASPTIPALTFASAAPTAICTSGCGTSSCTEFGGCGSSGDGDDCGTDGCDGGCGIQGCDVTCGLSCTTAIEPGTGGYDQGGDDGYDTTTYPDDPTITYNDGLESTPPHTVQPSDAEDDHTQIQNAVNNAITVASNWGSEPANSELSGKALTAIQDAMTSE